MSGFSGLFMVAEEYLPPTATRGAWALMSPAQVVPGSPLLKPERKEVTQREDWVATWRTSLPFVKDHVEKLSSPSAHGRIGQGHELQQRLKY